MFKLASKYLNNQCMSGLQFKKKIIKIKKAAFEGCLSNSFKICCDIFYFPKIWRMLIVANPVDDCFFHNSPPLYKKIISFSICNQSMLSTS